jgi:hypothetical protein
MLTSCAIRNVSVKMVGKSRLLYINEAVLFFMFAYFNKSLGEKPPFMCVKWWQTQHVNKTS